MKQSYETRVQAPRTANGFGGILECVVNPGYMRDYILVTSWVRDKSFNILPTTTSSIIDSSDNKYHMMSDGKLLIWQVGPQDARFSYQVMQVEKAMPYFIIISLPLILMLCLLKFKLILRPSSILKCKFDVARLLPSITKYKY